MPETIALGPPAPHKGSGDRRGEGNKETQRASGSKPGRYCRQKPYTDRKFQHRD
jgi:hypothetical protein